MKEEASKAVPGMPHHLVLEDRRALTVSGVSDVDSFDELTVIIYTDLGELTVKGGAAHQPFECGNGGTDAGRLDSVPELCGRAFPLGRLFRPAV